MRRFSLKTKMATLVSALFLVIFSFGAFMFENVFEEHYKKTIAEQQFELVSKIASDIDTQLREAQGILVAVSKTIPIDDINNYPAMQKHLERTVKSRFFIQSFFDDGIILYSRAGRIIGEVPYSSERYGKDFSGREYLQYTIKTKAPYISKPYRSTKPPYSPVVMFTAPVFDKNHDVAAILCGAVSLTKENTFGGIAGIKIGKTGYIYLYNTDRTIIVHPDKKMVLQVAAPPGTNRLFDKAINEWFEGSGETGTSKGIHVIGTFKRFKNTDWILAAHYPTKDAYAPIYRARWYIVGYTAIGVFLCVLIVLIVMRKNLSPLSDLASQAEIIGSTEERFKGVDVDAGGEIGTLASSFNSMLKRLSDREELLRVALENLGDREARISSIVNTTVEGIITISEKGIIESFNPAAEHIFGYKAAEAIGCNISMLMPEPHRSEHDGHIQAYVRDSRSKAIGTVLEVMGVRKDGTTFPVELSVSEANPGNRRFFTGVLRDITERKKAEEELQKLYRAVEYSSAVVIITDIKGSIEYINPKFTQVTGYERFEAIGKTPAILKSDETPVETYEQLWATITSGEEWQGIFHNRKKNGEFYWASASISPLKDTRGFITHFVGIQEDITAIKLFESELKEAKEMAERANQAKSDFLASMSHEIRTPMNAIIGMSELLLETDLDEEQAGYTRTLKNASESLLNIISNILDISKIEAGYLELESTEFNISELLDKACDIMSMKARDKGIDLSCLVLPEVPGILVGDPVRLRQVLLNLIGNAVKFTEKGEISIKVEVTEISGSSAFLKFSVRDTGIGIPADKIDKIFEKFMQADSSTTRKYGGTGLGLSICQRLVGHMGGDIWVNSSVGSGSTFFFTARFGIYDHMALPEPSIPAAGPDKQLKPPYEGLKHLRILLVDDSEDNRLLVLAFLKKMPFSIDTADNGNTAVEMFKNSPYDIVLMDIQMPIMDGYTATKEIRRWEKERHLKPTPILALTAYTLEEEARKSLNAGCNGYLAKPVRKTELIDAILAYAERPSSDVSGKA